MNHIDRYIENKILDSKEDFSLNEGLLSWLKAFIKKIKNNQLKLIQNGKVQMVKMDKKKIKIQKEPASLIELSKDKETIDIWSNPKIGFPESAKIIKNLKKYSPSLEGDEDNKKSTPYVYTFYYQGDNTYYSGIIMYDKTIEYIENRIHIINLETNLVVDNPSEIQKLMLDQFKDEMQKVKPSYEGFTTKFFDLHKFKPTMIKLGFKEDETLKEIYKMDK